MNEAKNNFNKQINEYLSDVKKRKNKYKKMIKEDNYDKESTKDTTGIVPLNDNLKRFYDIKPIEDGHHLFGRVNNKVYLGKDDIEGIDTYLVYAGVVFDDDSYNFHIFPNKKECYIGAKGTRLNEHYKAVQSALGEKLKERISELCSEHIEDEGVRLLFKNLAISKISIGKPNFKLMENILTVMGQRSVENLLSNNDVGIFCRYVSVETLTASYYIQLMRLTCEEYKEVGCVLRAIQFHKECSKGINKAKKENGEEVFDICYPNTAKNDAYGTNSAGNVCYNPTVDWPRFNEETKSYDVNDIKGIIDSFIDFIIREEKNETIDKTKALTL